jgi:hypothetical protein
LSLFFIYGRFCPLSGEKPPRGRARRAEAVNFRPVSIGRGLIVIGIAVAVSAVWFVLRPVAAPAVDFVDTLTGPTSAQFDIPFGKYMLTPEGLLRARSDSGRLNGVDRPVVRTRSDRYLSRDFVFEVDITIPPDAQDIVFVGVGHAESTAPFNEPGGTVGFRIHQLPTTREIQLAIISLPAKGTAPTYPFSETIGTVPEGERFTVRLMRSGDQITGSLPGHDGSERTIKTELFPMVRDKVRGFLYLSNTAEGTTFSNVSVRPRT